MVKVKTASQIEAMREGGKILRDLFIKLKDFIKPGITTKDIDKFSHRYIISKGGKPSCLGYEGFPASVCTSVNDVVVHGIPDNTVLEDGDIIGVDICVFYKGMHTDAARTFFVGNVSEEKQLLVKATEDAFFEGIKHIKDGSQVGDIGHQVQMFAESKGYTVVRELQGHGVGCELHEDPGIPNFGVAGTGEFLRAGMTIAVEPMINMGSRHVVISRQDGWTVRTKDGKPSAHYENTLLITKDGVEILTL
ncbi:MAG: type I methionyl aminopeptidase [Clostridia bacterium]|nr:type I methionyl aminopeptidase [Clostridia bacterium]